MSKPSKPTAKPSRTHGAANGVGAWVPWEVAEAVMRLGLKPASHWQVFMAIVFTWCRYGQGEARLTVAGLAEQTGLGTRTVQAAITNLIERKLVARIGRYGRLCVTVPVGKNAPGSADIPALPEQAPSPRRRAIMSALPKRTHACASPTVYMFSSLVDVGKGSFTQKQRDLVADIFAEASGLLGSDVGGLVLDGRHAEALGLPAASTYSDAIQAVTRVEDKALTRDFVKAVIALRRDDRVQGTLLISAERSGT